jgi:hypothetical protein
MNERVVVIGAVTLAGATVVAACQGRVDLRGIAGDDGQDAATGIDAGAPVEGMNNGEDASAYVPEDAGYFPQQDAAYYGNLDANYYQAPDASSCLPPPGLDAPSCWAACCTPAGQVRAFTSVADYYASIQGQWLFCDVPSALAALNAPQGVIGIEWGEAVVGDASCGATGGAGNCGGGLAWFLVQGASGPTHGLGFDDQLTYDVGEFSPGSFQLNLHPTPNSGYALDVKYSPCPREIQVFGMDANPGILVPSY